MAYFNVEHPEKNKIVNQAMKDYDVKTLKDYKAYLSKYLSKQPLNVIRNVIEKAIVRDDISILEMFEKYIPQISDSEGITPLMYASELGRLEIVKYLCTFVDINQVDSANCSALIYATTYGNSDIAIYLCKMGADPNIERTDGKNAGETALMYACWQCHYNAVAALISAGAKVNVSRKHGDRFTPLMYAMSNIYGVDSKRRIIKLLIQSDANVIATDSDGDTIYDFPGEKDILYMPPSHNVRNAVRHGPGSEYYYKTENQFKRIQYENTPLNTVANLVDIPQRKRKRKTRRRSTRKNHST